MTPKVSEEYKEEKKKEIIQAAATVFGSNGFYSTTMDDLVKASGISKGAIYHYFKSKEEVYEHMLQQQVEQTIQVLTDKFSHVHSSIEKIAVLFDLYTSNEWLKEPKLNSVRNQLEHWIAGSREEERAKFERHSKIFHDLINSILEEGRDSGEVSRKLNTSHAAKLFWSMIDGMLLHASVLPSFSYLQIVKTAKEMYISFLQKGNLG
ncbi:TetR/AcrR family transcriptional regulator [Psychrobacillus sp. FJAT-51614]|uniref:TetR/AcrR family transcriptional regulator n=1 Tax=Psychrobacillus mangrovi TaxID=3117745 RepID=A0ABU8F931_9BACI